MRCVVTDQAPVQYQDPVCLLDSPPLRLRQEAPVAGVACDDLDVDAQAGSVLDDLVLEALVDQGLADGAAGVLGDLVQQGDARGVVVEGGECGSCGRSTFARSVDTEKPADLEFRSPSAGFVHRRDDRI